MTIFERQSRGRVSGSVALALALAMCAASSETSADGYGGSIKDAPVVVTDEWAGHWFVRARAAYVMPSDGLDSVTITGPGAPLAAGADDSIDARWIPELDISYFLTKNWAIETICCLTKHTASGEGSLGFLGEAISAYVMPVSLLLQYHHHMEGGVKPYLGAGPVFSFFLAPKVGDGVKALNGGAHSKADIENFAFGGVVQAGVDIPLQGNWYVNLDVKKYYLRADADIEADGILGPGNSLHVNSFHFDPWIFGAGIGYKF